MKINYLAVIGLGTAFLAGVVVAGFVLLPSMAAINDALTCLTPACSDLAAQRSMALAAWAMVGLTIIATFVGGLSLALIFWTLDAARRSAVAAERTAEQAAASLAIAEESIALARRTSIAQTRSYVTVSGVTVAFRSDFVLVGVVLKNSGTTPARTVNVSLDVKCAITASGAYGQRLVSIAAPRVFLADIPAAAYETIDLTFPELSREDYEALSNNRLNAYVTGTLQYQDIYGEHHPYTFGFEGRPPTSQSVQDTFRLQRIPVPESEGLGWV